MSLDTTIETATPIDSIGDDRPSRRKSDYGNIAQLAASMALEGQRHPVLLMPNGQALKGGRRMAAARTLGWTTINTKQVQYMEDAVDAIRASKDELSEPRTVEEWVSLGLAIETLDRREVGKNGDSAEYIGRVVASSGATYKRGRYVVQTARSNQKSAYVVDAARKALALYDAGSITITTAYRRVRAAETAKPPAEATADGLPAVAPPSPQARSPRARLLREEWIRALAARGATSQQIADHLGISVHGLRKIVSDMGVTVTADVALSRSQQKGVDHTKAMRVAIDDLDALIWSFERIDPSQLDPKEAKEWAQMLGKYARSLSKFSRTIKGDQ